MYLKDLVPDINESLEYVLENMMPKRETLPGAERQVGLTPPATPGIKKQAVTSQMQTSD